MLKLINLGETFSFETGDLMVHFTYAQKDMTKAWNEYDDYLLDNERRLITYTSLKQTIFE